MRIHFKVVIISSIIGTILIYVSILLLTPSPWMNDVCQNKGYETSTSYIFNNCKIPKSEGSGSYKYFTIECDHQDKIFTKKRRPNSEEIYIEILETKCPELINDSYNYNEETLK